MIQRVQTLYLFVVPVIILLMFFVPVFSFETSLAVFKMYLHGGGYEDVFNEALPAIWYIVPALGVILAVITVATALQYKKRIRQLTLNKYALFVNILFIASIFFMTDRITSSEIVIKHAYNFGAYLSLVPAVFIYMANIRIRRDEQKVRAADRIR